MAVATVRTVGEPKPQIHDEFSYLLGADTLAHGRLANPPHPLALFFESPHILVRPTYASKYLPGQALWLALGERLFGNPYAGILIQGASFIFLLHFALMLSSGMLPALLVGLPVSIALLPPMDYFYSYWGGGAAAVSTALLFVGLALAKRTPTVGAVIAGLSTFGLLITRPYEGLTLVVIGSGLLCWKLMPIVRTMARQMIVPAGFVVLIGCGWLAYYNWRVTSNPLIPPYLLHDRRFNVAPVLWFLPQRPDRSYSNERLRYQHGLNGWEHRSYIAAREGLGPVIVVLRVAYQLIWLAGPLVLLLLLPWLSPAFALSFKSKTLSWLSVGCFVCLCLETWQMSHYAAPAFVVLTFLFASICADASRPQGNATSRFVRLSAILICATAVCVSGRAQLRDLRAVRETRQQSFADRRAGLIASLTLHAGKHLVLVSYADPKKDVADEWVYNSADIDSQKVIFAHDRGAIENRQILAYYPDRSVWSLKMIEHTQLLQAY